LTAWLQILFCGHWMRNGFLFTQEAVQRAGLAAALHVSECSSAELPQAIQKAHVAVPLMSRLDAPLLESAKQLRMILQFGVGLEAVDVNEVPPRKTRCFNLSLAKTQCCTVSLAESH
jgi:phosphoglycerate dehydrogenase-like enzyme